MGLTWGLSAGNINLRGRVLDEAKQSLPQANVRLLKLNGQTQAGIFTDIGGRFNLGSLPAGTYTLEVSFVGFVTHKQELTLTEQKNTLQLKDIILHEDKKTLREITVLGKANEVVVRGDTLEYNAGSYKTSDGAALEELVKKLPGVEVNESGQITINGKNVSKIMVDGKRFFESDPKIALKNLPADAIDKVQVLDRETDATRMTGFSDGDEETVINLTIKKSQKSGLFGTAYVGGGAPHKRYEANATLNRFSDGSQWSIIAGANNTNNAGFGDIASDLGQISNMLGGNTRGPRGSRGGNSNDGVTSSKVLGGNLAYTLGQKGELSSGTFLGNSDKLKESTYERTDIIATGSTTERGSSVERNDKYNTGANLRLEWKPTAKTTLIIAPNLNYGIGMGTKTSSSTTLRSQGAEKINTSELNQSVNRKVFSSRIHVDMSQKLGNKGRTLALSLQTGFNMDDAMGIYQSSLKNQISGAISSIDQHLETETRNLSYRARLSYVEPLANGFALQGQYQIRGEESSSHRLARQKQAATGPYDLVNPEYSNKLSSHFLSHRFGFALKKFTDKLDITAGLNLDPSHLSSYTQIGQEDRRINQNVLNYSPTFRLKYTPRKTTNLHIDYRGRSFQPKSDQLAPVQDKTNQLVIYEGNPNLKTGYMHNLFGRFSHFRASSKSSINLFAHLQYIQNDIVTHTKYNPTTGVRTIGYTNVDGNGMLSLGGFYTSPLPGKQFSVRVSSFNTLINQIGFVDEQRNDALAIRLSESLTLAYRHEGIDTSLKGTWSYYNVWNTLPQKEQQTTQDYRIDWDNQIKLPLGLSLEALLAYRTNSGYTSGYDQNQMLINVGLSYSFLKNKAATIRIKAYDALNQQSNISREISALNSSMLQTNSLGRYVMLHFIYRFNRFSSNASASDMRRFDSRKHPF
ncbi:MAG: TonB-dependent receptor [Porphyromonadaceae bacterium]|nr:TonB-dependent receptor [Porphyromonadaceae bacterium]